MFARLGLALSNKDRGRALKISAVMEIHRKLILGKEDMEILKQLSPRLSPYADGLSIKYFGEKPEPERCYLCGNLVETLMEEATEKGIELLSSSESQRFLVGVKLSKEIHEKEEKLKSEFGLPYAESIKNELKREIGKKIQQKGFTVDFDESEAILIIHFPRGEIELETSPIFYKARYWKIGRYISQSYWPTREGPPKYPFSVEQAAKSLLKVHKAEDVIIHASGREDADARMLGTGRPLVIEVKRPLKRRVEPEIVESALNEGGKGLVKFKVEGHANRSLVRAYKNELASSRKTYKILVVSEQPLSPEDHEELQMFFRNKTVEQRTPIRVLHRRSDITRRRKVYSVSTMPITTHVFLAVVEAEGGLYVKELVSGDEGRTQPSFTSVLKKQMVCVDLDVVSVDLGKPLNTV